MEIGIVRVLDQNRSTYVFLKLLGDAQKVAGMPIFHFSTKYALHFMFLLSEFYCKNNELLMFTIKLTE
jgi:hypothetical protein